MRSQIAEFLSDRLDEDEALLQAVVDVHCGGEWEAELLAEEGGRLGIISGNLIVAVMDTKHYGDACAPHITRHDPARALREVAAKRWILDQHPHTTYREHLGDSLNRTWGPAWERRNATILDRPYCEECHVDDGIIDGADGLPCHTLRMLAAVYADHPDYQEDWTL